jgi:hypothetical protein
MRSRVKRLRDPSSPPYFFPRAEQGAHVQHLCSNAKANWILGALLKGTSFASIVASQPYFMPVTPLRALEAALFMIGYELKGNRPY